MRLACNLFDEIAAAAGLTAVKESGGGRGLSPRCFELDADTVIETRDHGAMTVAELERLMRAAAHATRRCAARAAFTIARGSGRTRISSIGAATASASTTP